MLELAQNLFSGVSGVNKIYNVFQQGKLKPSSKNLRICSKGHEYYKSTDCPTCPVCEQERKPEAGFLSLVSAPAGRALERENINSLLTLSKCTEKELLKLHGIGPASLPTLKDALKEKGLSFRKK